MRGRAAVLVAVLLAAAIPATGAGGATVASPESVVGFGSAAGVLPVAIPVAATSLAAIAATPDGQGYWVASTSGGVFTAGDAAFAGAVGVPLAAPVVGMAPTPDGRGYWLAAADGGVFSFGDAAFLGSLAGRPGAPVVGIARTPDGAGYWLVRADGTVASFGDALSEGVAPARLAAPVVGLAPTPDGRGYWMVAADGGVLSFGDARFAGSLGGIHLAAPIVGMAPTPDGNGYWLAAADGGVFSFGDAPFEGSAAPTPAPAVGIAAAGSAGYWLALGHDPLGPAVAQVLAGRSDNVTAAVEDLTTGEVFTYRPAVVEHTASTVKVDILATLLQRATLDGRSLTSQEQSEAVPMIEESLDSAADSLWVEVGAGAVGDFERSAGMAATVPPGNGVWGETTTDALDRLTMVRDVALSNPLLTDAARGYILNLMEHVTPSQDWGATGGVPASVTVALKNGFSIIGGAWQVNTEGWVSGADRDYLIAVLTDGNPSEQYGIQTIDSVSSVVWNALG